ncbi:MAG: hypothetical protein JNJ60_09625 [Rhodocyclaceae bacterium]|nr:hypothetical protein [Rhodocyclaceae bacterium]
MSTTPATGLRQFLAMYEATGRHVAATLLLWALVEAGADRNWVSLTLRDLVRLLDGQLSLGAISGNIKRLERTGLLICRFDVFPTRRSYRIDAPRLCGQGVGADARAHEAQPLEDAR